MDSQERSEGQVPSSDTSSQEEEEDHEVSEVEVHEEEADGGKATDGKGGATAGGLARKITEPLALFYDREENEWDSSIEELPQTGSVLRLRHPPPQHIYNTRAGKAGKREPLAPCSTYVETNDNCRNRAMMMGQVVKVESKPSTTGYPKDVEGRLVYDSFQHNARRLMPRACCDEPFYKLCSESDETLVFDSLFESGNLYQAYHVGERCYDLVIKNDVNTNGHTQWYYFAASNTRANVPYTFRIINLYKRTSMYNDGLRPLLYSDKAASGTDGYGWRRCATDISYRRNEFQYSKGGGMARSYYTLKFTVEFPHSLDRVYLAHCYPFTYTDLQLFLAGLESEARTRRRCRRRLLCRTLAGNRCELLTITGNESIPDSCASDVSCGEEEAPQNQQHHQTKPCIVLSARVHPGETNASWMMQGCLEYLVGDSPGARRLRSQYVFKVVPMLNPDGVVVGNYRTGLAGCDLNRKWKKPSKTLQPTIYHMKQMMEEMRNERGIALFVDLHGHSVKKNVFMYGCDANYFTDAPNHSSRSQPSQFDSRLFPAQMERVCNKFNFLDCRFHVKPNKQSSARVVAWRQFTNYSYTLESSFGGADVQHDPCRSHFGVEDYLQIGYDLCAAMEQYLCVDVAEKKELLSALLKQVVETAIPDDDDDSDGEDCKKEDRPSSDDDSDDDTVETIVLPNTSIAMRAQAKKKVAKTSMPSSKASQKPAVKKGQKRNDDVTNPGPVAKKETLQSAREDPLCIAKDVAPARELPEKQDKQHSSKHEKPIPELCTGRSPGNIKCDCPSCQVCC